MNRSDRPAITALDVADPADRWRALGFAVGDDEILRLGGIELRLGVPGRGITGWTVTGAPGLDAALGLAEAAARGAGVGSGPTSAPMTGGPLTHPNGANGVDHVVVVVPDFDATVAALQATGLALRRVRQASETVRQGFRRLGPAILEVVEAPGASAPALWGLVVIVPDLPALQTFVAPHLKPPRPAVQPGRHIAPVAPSAGLTTQLAFMDPEPGERT